MTEREKERLFKITSYDRDFWSRPDCILAGMDEVGRGPLAGPVVVSCVVMPPDPLVEYVNDSKKVSEKRRGQIYPKIIETALDYSVSFVWQDTIDQINILEATKKAFVQAFQSIRLSVTDVMIDALQGLNIEATQHVLIHGDALCYSIAAASIIAKVNRDNYMIEMDEKYPEYGFARNKGYGTAEHIAALKKYGPCPLHRRSFIGKFI